MVIGVPNGTVIDQPNVISFPAEFTASAKATLIARNASNFAAYGLELLDNRVPGLYDDLLASRQDPTKQRDAIRKIESIRPGLYRELRELEYTTEDFLHGLKLVIEALGSSQSETRGG